MAGPFDQAQTRVHAAWVLAGHHRNVKELDASLEWLTRAQSLVDEQAEPEVYRTLTEPYASTRPSAHPDRVGSPTTFVEPLDGRKSAPWPMTPWTAVPSNPDEPASRPLPRARPRSIRRRSPRDRRRPLGFGHQRTFQRRTASQASLPACWRSLPRTASPRDTDAAPPPS